MVTKMSIKIAVVGTRGIPATYGGIEKHCEELYSRLADMGYEIEIYTRDYYTDKEYTEYKGIKIKNIPTPINISGFETLYHSFVATLMATFSDVDIIHIHAQGPAIFSWIPRLLSPKKTVVFTCHGIDWQRDKWKFPAKNIIKFGENASAVFPHYKIGVSQSLVDYYYNEHKTQLYKVYNGINIDSTEVLSLSETLFNLKKNEYFLFVGRLVPEKAPDTLIMAMQRLNTDKKLVIIGESANTDEYVKYLKEIANNDPRIIFIPYVYGKALNTLYSNAYAYISASSLEGLPITVLEAMSFSKPVILSEIEPHKEIISFDSSAGILFKVNNSQDCQKAMQKILNLSPDEYKKMCKSVYNIVSNNFEWKNIVKETEKIYTLKNSRIPDSLENLAVTANKS